MFKNMIRKVLFFCVYNINRFAPQKAYPFLLKLWYWIYFRGQRLDLKSPRRFTEKMQYLKLYDNQPIKARLSDKYEVREWVAQQIGREYLTDIIGVWERFDDIDFSQLPEKFVLKPTHGSGMVALCRSKSKFDIPYWRKKFKGWMKKNIAYAGLELCYRDIKPRILAEKYMENAENDLYDYKVWCFNGKPEYVMFLAERSKGLKMVFYDLEWHRMPFRYFPAYEKEVPKPENLSLMLELAEKLARDFAHARVDFYVLNSGEIKFGEITFYSAGGYAKWVPEEWDNKLGDLLKLEIQ